MDDARLAELLDRTAGVLLDLAGEFRAIVEDLPVAHRAEENRSHQLVVTRIKNFWTGVTLAPTMSLGGYDIDLSTPEGRWELLVLGVLKGARVRESAVERTFAALNEQNLLQIDPLVENSPPVRDAVKDVFARYYRALGNKDAKVQALFANAAHLKKAWMGDLNTIYHDAQGDDRLLLRHLRAFKQIDHIALWVCRTLKVHGIWPEVGDDVVRYYDRFARLPVERLFPGLNGDADDAKLTPRQSAGVIDDLFAGDVIPLYLHGFSLCSQNDAQTCLGECPVATWCRFPKENHS